MMIETLINVTMVITLITMDAVLNVHKKLDGIVMEEAQEYQTHVSQFVRMDELEEWKNVMIKTMLVVMDAV